MIVFIVDMQQSGSTFAFNIVRDILLARGSLYQEASPRLVAELEKAGEAFGDWSKLL